MLRQTCVLALLLEDRLVVFGQYDATAAQLGGMEQKRMSAKVEDGGWRPRDGAHRWSHKWKTKDADKRNWRWRLGSRCVSIGTGGQRICTTPMLTCFQDEHWYRRSEPVWRKGDASRVNKLDKKSRVVSWVLRMTRRTAELPRRWHVVRSRSEQREGGTRQPPKSVKEDLGKRQHAPQCLMGDDIWWLS